MAHRFRTFVLSMLFIASFMVLSVGATFAQEEEASDLNCAPEDPPPASTLNCQADGLQADGPAQWSAQFAGGSTDGGEVTADAQGTAQFQLDVPDEPGSYTVTVEGTDADGAAYSRSFSGEVRSEGTDEEGDTDDEGDADEECPDEGGDEEGNADEGNGDDDCPEDDAGGEGDQDDDENGETEPAEGGQGEGEQGEGQEKISLCHATASETNPYTFITVGAPAATKGGHANHEDDIIPADGPEDCPFGEAVLSCISTAGVGSEDANPILCRVLDLQADQGAEWEATCPDGASPNGVVTADSQGVGHFEFTCSTGDFEVMVLGSARDGSDFQAAGTGVAGVFFGDDVAAPAPPPQVGEVPVGPVAAGYGGTAGPDRTAGIVTTLALLMAFAALTNARLSRTGRSAGQR